MSDHVRVQARVFVRRGQVVQVLRENGRGGWGAPRVLVDVFTLRRRERLVDAAQAWLDAEASEAVRRVTATSDVRVLRSQP